MAIYNYTRRQAIADGILVDVSKMAEEAGFRFPVALTANAWNQYVKVPEDAKCQDEQGRLWDILNMLRFAIQEDGNRNELEFSLYVNNTGEPKLVLLKSICGPGDTFEPVVTIMLPDEY